MSFVARKKTDTKKKSPAKKSPVKEREVEEVMKKLLQKPNKHSKTAL